MINSTAPADYERLRISEIHYRRLFEAAQDGVLLVDPATRKITDANPFMKKLLGYSHDELIGKELFEIGLLKDEVASQEIFLALPGPYSELDVVHRTDHRQFQSRSQVSALLGLRCLLAV